MPLANAEHSSKSKKKMTFVKIALYILLYTSNVSVMFPLYDCFERSYFLSNSDFCLSKYMDTKELLSLLW